jgi:hypothetical protein
MIYQFVAQENISMSFWDVTEVVVIGTHAIFQWKKEKEQQKVI